MQPARCHKKLTEKFNSLEGEDESIISWSSSGSEDLAYSCMRSGLRKPVKISRKRKPKRHSRNSSAKLHIREISVENKSSYIANISGKSTDYERPESPILYCSLTANSVCPKRFGGSKYENVKFESSPVLTCVNNENSQTKDITCTESSKPTFSDHNQLFGYCGRLLNKKITVPIYKSISHNSNESCFSPNKELLSSPVLSQERYFNKTRPDNTISHVSLSLENENGTDFDDFPSHLNKVNISPLLTNRILIHDNRANAKRILYFGEPIKGAFLENNEAKTDVNNKNLVLSEQLQKQTLAHELNNLISNVHNVDKTNNTECSSFKKFSFKSEPSLEIPVNNETPEITNNDETSSSQATIETFTLTSAWSNNSQSKEITAVSSPSVVTIGPAQDTPNHNEFVISGPISASKLRRKRLKKDGLAYRLQNAIKCRKSALSIWKHEMYLAENSNFDIPIGDPPLVLKIIEGKKEHSVLKLYCEHVDGDNKYVLLLDDCIIKSAIFKVGQCISLYKPYELYPLRINDNLVTVIVNAYKING